MEKIAVLVPRSVRRKNYLATELFEDLIEEIVQASGAKHLEFELWDAADRSKMIFDELGIDLTDGEWQYDC